jgi:zinc/manganese transport system permease protein
MGEILLFMAPSICMCVILVGICAYVGIHVILREVIFIDIALAQVAALGASLSLFFEFDLDHPATYAISLSFTLIASYLLSETRRLTHRVPQEAFIGILYATAAAAVLLLGDRLAHGSEHVHDMMCGHLLWVSWHEVTVCLVIYALLGLIYYALHTRLLEHSGKEKSGRNGILWDFIFYALLSILVTVAVRIAGVLLVFGFLIVPAVIGTLLSDSFVHKLMIAWLAGAVISLLGSYLSFKLDFPTGALIVVTLGLGLLLIAFIKVMQLKFTATKPPRGTYHENDRI